MFDPRWRCIYLSGVDGYNGCTDEESDTIVDKVCDSLRHVAAKR